MIPLSRMSRINSLIPAGMLFLFSSGIAPPANGIVFAGRLTEEMTEAKEIPECGEPLLHELQKEFPNFGMVNPRLFRGAQPDLEKLYLLKEARIVSIISFRTEKENVDKERKISEELGMKFFNIPWNGRDKVKDRQVEEFLSIVSDAGNLPAFVHCKRGAERTGVMLACFRMVYDGWTAEEAYREMKTYKFRTFWFRHLKKFVFKFEKRMREKMREGSAE